MFCIFKAISGLLPVYRCKSHWQRTMCFEAISIWRWQVVSGSYRSTQTETYSVCLRTTHFSGRPREGDHPKKEMQVSPNWHGLTSDGGSQLKPTRTAPDGRHFPLTTDSTRGGGRGLHPDCKAAPVARRRVHFSTSPPDLPRVSNEPDRPRDCLLRRNRVYRDQHSEDNKNSEK